MRTRSSSNLIVESFTIPKRRNCRHSKQIVEPELRTIVETPVVTMADTRTMSKLLQVPTEGYRDAIVIPAILAENFELKVGLLSLVTSSQFHGFERDDPHSHIRWFNKITSTLKYKNVSHDAIKLMLFLISLGRAARTWLEKESPRSIHTWEDLVSKDLVRHGIVLKIFFVNAYVTVFSELHQIDTFYNALTQSDQDSLNVAAGGNLLNRTPRDALTIIVEIKELVLMNKANQQATLKAIEETCVTCGGPHLTMSVLLPIATLLILLQQRGLTIKEVTDTVLKETRIIVLETKWDHLVFLLRMCKTIKTTIGTIKIKEIIKLRTIKDSINKEGKTSIKETTIIQLRIIKLRFIKLKLDLRMSYRNMKSNKATLRAMQTQMTNMKTELWNEFKSSLETKTNKIENQNNQIMNMLTNLRMQNQNPSSLGSLPSNTVANPRGNVKAITTRSDVSYDGPTIPPTSFPLPKEVECETEAIKDKVQPTSSKSTTHVQPLVVQIPIPEPEVTLKPNPKPSIPYPSRLNNQKLQPFAPGTYSYSHDSRACKQIVDYDVDPRVPLILERPFLRTARALIDVHGEELTLRVNNKAITFKVGHTSRYSRNYYDETVNQINVIDVVCEEYAQEVLGFLDGSTSGNPTPLNPIIASFSPSFTPFEGGDFILEEIETFLRTPDEIFNLDDDYYVTKGDILYLEKLLNEDPSPNLPSIKNDDLNHVDVTMTKPSIEEPPKLELKDLPSHLEYAFLEGTNKLPVIISKELKDEEKAAL
uniref:Reverse transcriptase domain-containing protein n=1 Tax=Tanacetum cinerariifolium TaxID=118510 RepID=A0A6L2LQ10_TANCI|nr:reverse transcriptase domain-containing protein [Tanacetum cinerariifolium]